MNRGASNIERGGGLEGRDGERNGEEEKKGREPSAEG